MSLEVTHIVDAWHEHDFLDVVPVKPVGEPVSYVVLVAQENGRTTELQLDDFGIDQLVAALVAARNEMPSPPAPAVLDLGAWPMFDEDADAPTITEESKA